MLEKVTWNHWIWGKIFPDDERKDQCKAESHCHDNMSGSPWTTGQKGTDFGDTIGIHPTESQEGKGQSR
jgi:hypothetical protein